MIRDPITDDHRFDEIIFRFRLPVEFNFAAVVVVVVFSIESTILSSACDRKKKQEEKRLG